MLDPAILLKDISTIKKTLADIQGKVNVLSGINGQYTAVFRIDINEYVPSMQKIRKAIPVDTVSIVSGYEIKNVWFSSTQNFIVRIYLDENYTQCMYENMEDNFWNILSIVNTDNKVYLEIENPTLYNLTITGTITGLKII